MLNPRLGDLGDYMFQRLALLLAGVAPAAGRAPIDLSIGQPMHPVPELLTETLRAHGHLWGRYPPVAGTPEFRAAAAAWLTRRYHLPPGALDPERHVLPCVGTKEALFMIAQAVVPERKAGRTPAVLLPNPFYNVYLGGAALAGAEPVLLSVSAQTGHLPALDELAPELLERTAAFYLCSPANPQGAAADLHHGSHRRYPPASPRVRSQCDHCSFRSAAEDPSERMDPRLRGDDELGNWRVAAS